MRTLARKYQTIRFVKIHHEEAEMDPVAVPAILAYRAGDKFAGLVPVMDALPADRELSVLSLEHAMKRYRLRPIFTFPYQSSRLCGY